MSFDCASALASMLNAYGPTPGVSFSEPLTLTTAQEQAAGPALTKLLRQRVAYHHSGLSYLQRAGLIEYARGQLRDIAIFLGSLLRNQLVISIAAGIRSADLIRWL